MELEAPPSPKRPSAFEADPGHMLAKLNCASAPATATESADQTRYEFSVEVALAPTIFSATKVCPFRYRQASARAELAVSAKFVLMLQCACQLGVNGLLQVRPHSLCCPALLPREQQPISRSESRSSYQGRHSHEP